jgi:threonine-phosphate decarboxylase
VRRFEHGGDIYTHKGVLDFSANLNPLGMPQAARDVLRENVHAFEAYPDPQCSELVAELAREEGVKRSELICTAGATDLMTRVVMALRPETAIVTAPCYSGYEQALEQGNVGVFHHALREEDGFAVTARLLDDIRLSGAQLIFIANPNNPTGLAIAPKLLEEILICAGECGARVVLDECFIGFTHETSMASRIDEFPQLIVMKALTKLYSMAGLRLGYGLCSDASFMQRLHEVGQPWAVSTPAQMAGLASLRSAGFVDMTRAYVMDARIELKAGLESCGLRVVDGQANYLMFECDRKLYDPLLERGVLIRRCENYDGLDATWYRVAVRTREENAQLIAALKEVLA